MIIFNTNQYGFLIRFLRESSKIYFISLTLCPQFQYVWLGNKELDDLREKRAR